MIGLDEWPASAPPVRPMLSAADEIIERLDATKAEIDHQAAQLDHHMDGGNYGQARTAALCLATAAQVYVQLTNALQKTDH